MRTSSPSSKVSSRPTASPQATDLRPRAESTYRRALAQFADSEPDLLRWSIAFRREGGDRLDFSLFPFQPQIYRDFGNPDLETVDVMKSAQCGISAAAVSLALYCADVWEGNTIYVLPGFGDAYDFSDTRIKPAIDDSPYLSSRVQSTDNKGLKRIGEANFYVRGSGSEKQALSIPGDLLILDEFDRLVQAQIPMFEARLSSPTSLKLQRRFSNPSWPEYGIDELFRASDRCRWLVRCPACSREAPVFYDAGGEGHHYVDEEREVRACGACNEPLTAQAIAEGRWVAESPGRPRGYHVSKLLVPSENIATVIAHHRRKAEEQIQTHYNMDLGLPYTPRGGALDRDLILACRRDYTPPTSYHGSDWVTAGIDVGKVLHVRISRWLANGTAAPLFVGEVPDFEGLAQLWTSYSVNFGLIDERPEERKARDFLGSHRGRCMLVRWAGEEQHDEVVEDRDQGLVIARRTWSCDQTVAAFTEQKRLLGRTVTEDYIRQLTRPHRVVGTNPKTGKKFGRYESNEQADHFFFAETYDLLARHVRQGAVTVDAVVNPPTLRDALRRR